MKIKELENQNRALTSILVHQLRGEASAGDQDVADGTEIVISPENGRHTSLKHCNSFNSEVLDEQPVREDQCDTLKNLSENNLKALSYEVMGKLLPATLNSPYNTNFCLQILDYR